MSVPTSPSSARARLQALIVGVVALVVVVTAFSVSIAGRVS
jgi:hypothetical protein